MSPTPLRPTLRALNPLWAIIDKQHNVVDIYLTRVEARADLQEWKDTFARRLENRLPLRIARVNITEVRG